MKHEMKLKPQYFDMIKAGKKVYEIRLNDEKRKLIKVGDLLEFKREPKLEELLVTQITELLYFTSFEEMLGTISSKLIGFVDATKEEIISIYRKFYSEADEKNYGVVAIKISLI